MDMGRKDASQGGGRPGPPFESRSPSSYQGAGCSIVLEKWGREDEETTNLAPGIGKLPPVPGLRCGALLGAGPQVRLRPLGGAIASCFHPARGWPGRWVSPGPGRGLRLPPHNARTKLPRGHSVPSRGDANTLCGRGRGSRVLVGRRALSPSIWPWGSARRGLSLSARPAPLGGEVRAPRRGRAGWGAGAGPAELRGPERAGPVSARTY